MNDYLSGEAAESFDDDEGLSEAASEPSSPAYAPVAAWAVDEHLPPSYFAQETIGLYKTHRLVTCLSARDLDPDTDRSRPRLRCLDCGEEADDPTDLSPFHDPCPTDSSG